MGFKPSGDPLAWAGATIYLPTRRACRLAQQMFLDVLDRDAAILPRIDPSATSMKTKSHSPISPWAMSRATNWNCPRRCPACSAPPAARRADPEMGRPRHRAEGAGRSTADRQQPGHRLRAGAGPRPADGRHGDAAGVVDRLDDLVPDEFDKYWEITLGFLKFIRTSWPVILNEKSPCRAGRTPRQTDRRRDAPPRAPCTGPVIAAGSTGSMPSTAILLATIAALPQGALVLPGLDTDLDDGLWQTHCQGRRPGRRTRSPAILNGGTSGTHRRGRAALLRRWASVGASRT